MKIIIFLSCFEFLSRERVMYFIVKAVVIYLILKRSYLQMVFYLKKGFMLCTYISLFLRCQTYLFICEEIVEYML